MRTATVSRTTTETAIELTLALEGTGTADVSTGLPFFDHMLAQLGKHGGLDLKLTAKGDLEVDAHHTVEDCGIAFGDALSQALGSKAGIARFGFALIPLDEALCEVALDLSGRPYLVWEVETGHERVGAFDPHLAEHFWRSVAQTAGITLHVIQRAGTDPHHILEAAFKAVARALRDAVRESGIGIPSTKGTL